MCQTTPVPSVKTPPLKNAAHLEDITKYTTRIYKPHVSLAFEGEELWEEFIMAFRPRPIHLWERQPYTWIKDNGVHIGTCKKVKKSNHLIDILYRDIYYASTGYIEKKERFNQES